MGWAEENWVRGAGYLVVTVVCLLAWRRDDRSGAGYWPLFWPISAGLLSVMAIGRAGDVANVLGDLMRERARGDGWYGGRRRWQAVVVCGVGVGWGAAVLFACTRSPERRRRYLPMTIVLLTIGAFVALRMVSLHHVDSVLHRHDIAGLRVGTAAEFALLAVAAAVAMWSTSRRQQLL